MPVIIRPGATNTNKATVLWDNVLARADIIRDSGSGLTTPAINATQDTSTWSSWAKDMNNFRSSAVYDCGEPVTVDGWGVSSHNLWSSGTGIRIQRSDDGVNWTVIYLHYATSDEDFMVLFPPVTARYFMTHMYVGTGVGVGFVGSLFLGRRLTFPHAPVDGYRPLHHSRSYEKLYNDSIKGHFLSNRVMAAGAETSVDMGFLDRDWLELNIRGFERHYNQGGTFFFAGCPSRYPDDMGYCRSAGSDESLSIEFIEGDKLSSLSFGVRSFVG